MSLAKAFCSRKLYNYTKLVNVYDIYDKKDKKVLGLKYCLGLYCMNEAYLLHYCDIFEVEHVKFSGFQSHKKLSY